MTINSRRLLSLFLALATLAVANTTYQGATAPGPKDKTSKALDPSLTLISSYRSWTRMNVAFILVPFDTMTIYA